MFRKNWFVNALLVAVVLLTACQPVAPPSAVLETGVETTLDAEIVAEIEAVVAQEMGDGVVPGLAMGIVRDGQVVYEKGFGVAKLGSGTPITPRSLFQVASVSKTTVAMAIIQLADRGLINLDSPVTEYLPYFTMADEAYTGITVRQLLAHRAGLPPSEDSVIRFQTEEPRYDDSALEDHVRSLAESPLLFVPGEGYSYSTIGFNVLGDVIAKASGQTFEAYMKENILIPLGMTDSTFLLKEANPDLLTTPHMYADAGNAETIDFYPYDRRYAPGAGLYASVHDLSRMALAHLNRGELDGVRVLPASAYDEMWTPYSETGWAEYFGPTWTSYGLGWLMGEDGRYTVYNHTGADSGYQAHILVVPDANLAVVVLVNVFDRDEGSFHAYATADAVMKILLEMEL